MIRKLGNAVTLGGKLYMAAASLAFTIAGLIGAFMLYTILQNFSSIQEFSNFTALLKFGLLLAGLVLAKMGFALIGDLANHYAGFDVEVCIREKVVHKLKQLSLGFYTKERLGDVSLVVHEDVQNLQAILGHAFSGMVSDILVAAVIGVFLFSQSLFLGLAMVSTLPIAYILLLVSYKKNANIQSKTANSLFTMVSRFIEYIKGIPLLRAYGGGSLFEKNLKQSIDEFNEYSTQQAKATATAIGLFSIFFELAYGVMVLTGAVLVISQGLPLPIFLFFVILSREFYKPFKNSETYWLEYISAKDSYTRVERILETPVPAPPVNPARPTRFDIEFENVSFKYEEDSFSLNNLSFNLPQGSLTALVGTSGSGKTTVTNLLLRFWEIDSGTIRVGGIDLQDIDYDTFLTHVSIVMQNVILFSGTVEDNIRIGKRNASFKEIEDAARKAQIHDFILSLPDGYKTQLGENGAGLSGGQKQRISIARAFLKDAPIVLLDEITSNIDPVNEHEIQLAVNRLVKGRTVIVIAHNLQTIQNADHILVFDKGRVVEQGTHSSLLDQNKLYTQMWNRQ